jgi:2-polyprenylphenol hydroxylase and related flavodoxin oxidoreductases
MSTKIRQVEAEIVKNKKITPTVYYLELSIPGMADDLRPGQFLHLRIGTGVDPLLRRPLSVYSLVKKNKVAIVYKVVGKGTRLLAEKQTRETVDVLGPLGNGFTVRNGPAILVAGGMGVAPMVFLAQALLRKRNKPGSATAAFIGMNTKKNWSVPPTLKKWLYGPGFHR